MERIEALISAETNSVGPLEGISLLAVRKEYLRRELTIKLIMRGMEKMEKDFD